VNAKSFELATGETLAAFAKRLGRNYNTAHDELKRGYGCIMPPQESSHPLWSIWYGMIQRCYNNKRSNYRYYGGRGIRVCARWFYSMDAFAQDMGPRPEGYQIDRTDNDMGYSPDNCRWVSTKVNTNNRRSNVHLTHNGETRTATEWADHLRISARVIQNRIHLGWTTEEVLGFAERPPLAISGHKHINFIASSGNWRVRKRIKGKLRYFGTFTTLDVAIAARDGMSEVAV